MTPHQPLPPAIVFGVDTPIGLTVVRELGEKGVAVHGIARSPRGLGLFSKHLARGYLCPPDADETLELLNQIGRREGARFLLAVSERDLLRLRHWYDEGMLTEVRPLVPKAEQLTLVNDKAATCKEAEACGLAVPYTWEPPHPDAQPPHMKFPCVLKWRDPGQIAPLLSKHNLPLVKAEYCYSLDELRSALKRYLPIDSFPLVQAYCPGVGIGQSFFLHEGKALLRFQHRRSAEWPPGGGVSTVCRSLHRHDHADLMQRSELLLQRIGWEGCAMVEYRFDPTTERAVLMEINGRFWGSLPLAYHAGAPFAWFTYAVLGLGMKLEAGPYQEDLICRYMVPETRRLLTVLFRRRHIKNRDFRPAPFREIVSYLKAFLHPRTRYYVFSVRDPRPFVVDTCMVVRKAMVSLCRSGWRSFAQILRVKRTANTPINGSGKV